MMTFANPDSEKIELKERLNEVCRGDADAIEFCLQFCEFCHFMDDVVDGDFKPNDLEMAEYAGKVSLQYTSLLLFNPFLQKYKEALWPVILQGVSLWLDSIHLEKHQEKRFQKMADALKSVYGEVVFAVAYRVGGFDHMREMSRKYRAFDFDIKD